MKRKLISFLMLSGLTLCSNSALADVPIASGWYLEGNVGASRLLHSNVFPFGYSNRGVGFNVNAGYKFIPYMAAELGLTRYATAQYNKNIFPVSYQIQNNYRSADLALRAILPIVETGFELFAKLGASVLNTNVKNTTKIKIFPTPVPPLTHVRSTNESAFSFFLGIGMEYFISCNVPINFQWQRANGSGNTGTADLYSVGIAFLMG